MPAIVRRNVSAPPRVRAGVERASMEETAECPDAAGVLGAMVIDRRGCPAGLEDGRSNGMLDGAWNSDEAVQSRNRDDEADV
jgi:hypothetical protein